jgi:hypothetical protein
MDGEFEKIKDLVPRLECNTTAAKEHASEAEREIRTIKERARGLITTLPFEHIPRRMKIVFIILCPLAKCISSQERNIFHALPTRIDGTLEARLQTTLPSRTGHILQGAR